MGLLSQALKNFFPLHNGDNDFTSSCKIPYFNASNNPDGCVSPSKLASVLGVKTYIAKANSNTLSISLPTKQSSHYHVYIGNLAYEALSILQAEYVVGMATSSSANQVVALRTPAPNISSFAWDGSSIVVNFASTGYYIMIASPIYFTI